MTGWQFARGYRQSTEGITGQKAGGTSSERGLSGGGGVAENKQDVTGGGAGQVQCEGSAGGRLVRGLGCRDQAQ